MAGMVTMEYREEMGKTEKEESLVPLGPLAPKEPQAHVDLKAHLDPLANVASLAPLGLQDQPPAPVELFMYVGDEQPVPAHLKHSWSMKEEPEGLIVPKGGEATTCVYHIIQNIQTTKQEIKVDLSFVELNI